MNSVKTSLCVAILSVLLSACMTSPALKNAVTDYGPYPKNYEEILRKHLAWHGGNRMLSATKPQKMNLTVEKLFGGGLYLVWDSYVCFTPNTVQYIGTRCQNMLINSGEVIETYNWELKSLRNPR